MWVMSAVTESTTSSWNAIVVQPSCVLFGTRHTAYTDATAAITTATTFPASPMSTTSSANAAVSAVTTVPTAATTAFALSDTDTCMTDSPNRMRLAHADDPVDRDGVGCAIGVGDDQVAVADITLDGDRGDTPPIRTIRPVGSCRALWSRRAGDSRIRASRTRRARRAGYRLTRRPRRTSHRLTRRARRPLRARNIGIRAGQTRRPRKPTRTARTDHTRLAPLTADH